MAWGRRGLCQTGKNRTCLWMPISICCHLGEADVVGQSHWQGWNLDLLCVRACVCFGGGNGGWGWGSSPTPTKPPYPPEYFQWLEESPCKTLAPGHTSVSDGYLFLRAGQEEHFLRAARYWLCPQWHVSKPSGYTSFTSQPGSEPCWGAVGLPASPAGTPGHSSEEAARPK